MRSRASARLTAAGTAEFVAGRRWRTWAWPWPGSSALPAELGLARRLSGRHHGRAVVRVTRARGGEERRERKHCANEGEEDWPRHCHRPTYRQQPGGALPVPCRPPHRRQGRARAGPPLEAERTLANQHLQAHRPRAPRRARPTQAGCSGHPRTPDRPRSRAAPSPPPPAPRARRRLRRALRSCSSPAGRPARAHARDARRGRARGPRSARGVRLSTATSAPAPLRAQATARAAPPAPSTSARIPRGSSSSASRKPAASVFSACTPPSARVRVFAAPMAVAAGLRLSASSSAATLCGTVTLSPRKPERPRAATTGSEQVLGQRQRHVEPVQAQLGQGSVVHGRRAAVAHGPAGHPEQRAAHQQLVGDCPPRRARSRL